MGPRRPRTCDEKAISLLLDHLPRTNNYKVIFRRRDLSEVLASQAKMLAQRGQCDSGTDDALHVHYEGHLRNVNDLLSHDSAFSALDDAYVDVLSVPQKAAQQVSRFIGGGLDVARRTAIVDTQLYRNCRAPL